MTTLKSTPIPRFAWRWGGWYRALFANVALVAACPSQGPALDLDQPAASYLRTNFTVEDGLASNIGNAVLQTRDGFLWVGTNDGLVRFDGRHFTTFDFLTRVSHGVAVNALAEAADGALWVGTAGGMARIPSQSLEQFGDRSSALYHPGSESSDSVRCLHFSRDGVLWVGTDGGLYRFKDGRFSTIIPKLLISRIEEASNGHLLVITSKGFMEWDGAKTVVDPELPGRLGVKTNEIFNVFEDRRGVIWYCTKGGVARQIGGSIERLQPYDDRGGHEAFRAYEDAKGTVWISRNGGLSRVAAAGLEVVFPDVRARYLTFDRDGDLWAVTNGAGLFEFKSRRIQMFTPADGLPVGVPMTVLAAKDGKLWVGSNCGGLSWFDGQRFHVYAEKEGLLNSCIFSLAEDGRGDIWIGTYGGGVFRFHDGHFTRLAYPDELANNGAAIAILPAKDGALWIAYSNRLSRVRNGEVRSFTTADGFSSNRILSAYEDRQGVIWVETDTGIDRLAGDRFVALGRTGDVFFTEGPFGFGEDRLGELFAFALWNGTFHIRESQLIRVAGAPPITGMAKTQQDLWFCGAGIYRAAPDSLERWERERTEPADYTQFGRADGMNTAECSGGFRNMAVTEDNKLWVATLQGLAMLDVSRLSHADRKPAIYVEKVVVGKMLRPPNAELVVAPGTHHVELHFAAIELASPERIRLQYRLDDVDREWLDADTTSSAVYTDFPIGTHKFHVRACNRDGIWDREGIVYNITQEPYYFETTLFRFAAAAILLLLLAGVYNFRLRQLRVEMTARLDERVMERTRLARELHDTLLQTIQGSKMVADHALDEPSDANRMRRALERLSSWLAQATEEGRAALSALRVSTVQRNDLAEALSSACEDCTSNSSMTFTVTADGRTRDMHPIVRDDIYRIAYEAIRNASAHSKGSKLDVALKYSRDFVLLVRDNGIGIAPDLLVKAKNRHFGLLGMQERSERIGAKLSLRSKTPGTEVELLVPGNLAYCEKKVFWRRLAKIRRT